MLKLTNLRKFVISNEAKQSEMPPKKMQRQRKYNSQITCIRAGVEERAGDFEQVMLRWQDTVKLHQSPDSLRQTCYDNDKTWQGLKQLPVFACQYQPEAKIQYQQKSQYFKSGRIPGSMTERKSRQENTSRE